MGGAAFECAAAAAGGGVHSGRVSVSELWVMGVLVGILKECSALLLSRMEGDFFGCVLITSR